MEVELHELELRYAELRIEDARRQSELVAGIAEVGQQAPVLVLSEGDRYVLIDGYARVAALRALGRDQVAVVVLELPEAEALVLAHRLESKRPRSALEEGWLISELLERHGMPQQDVARRLHRTQGWVSRRLGLVRDLPVQVQDAIRHGRLPPHAAAKYLVPMARANREHCELLVRGLGAERMTDRQIGRLYFLWRVADEEGRRRIVEHPHLALKADSAQRPEPPVPEGDPTAPLLDDLQKLTWIGRRAQRRLDEGLLGVLDDRRRNLINNSVRVAHETVRALVERLEEETRCSTATPEPPS